jgi:PAS domain S-box-containing protein
MEDTNVLYHVDNSSYHELMEEAQRLAHFGAWEVNIHTGAVKWSSEMYHMLGYDPQETEATFNNFIKKLHREDILYVKKNLENLLIYPSEDTYDFRIVDKVDGSIRYLRTGIVVKRNTKGIATSMTGFSHDITAQKLAEKKIEKVNKELNTFFNVIDDVFFSVDIRQNRLIQISQACEKLYGYSDNELLADFGLWNKILHPMDRETVALGDSLLAHGETVVGQYRIIRKDSVVCWVESKLIPTLDKTGNLIRLDGVTRDITERRMAEESLKKSEANLRTVFEHTDIGYVLYNSSLNIVSFNAQAYDFFLEHYDINLKIGINGADVFKKDKRKLLDKIIIKLGKGKIVNYETNYYKNDEVKWFDVKWVGVLNEQAEQIGVLLTFKDITEKKVLELEREKITADLVQRNKDQEQFNYMISHNLRAPVANITGLLEMLSDPHLEDDERSYILNGISQSVKSLDSVIIDMNHVLQTRELINETREDNNLELLIDEIKFSIENIILKEQVTIKCELEVENVFTIRSYLYSIFYNLILNSIKYRQPGIAPVIVIKSALVKNKIELTFTDNGKGINLHHHGAQLFRLYKRFDTSVEGKGMGLFMVKTQVESMDGTITVTSEPEVGTEFIIRLPGESRKSPKNRESQ